MWDWLLGPLGHFLPGPLPKGERGKFRAGPYLTNRAMSRGKRRPMSKNQMARLQALRHHRVNTELGKHKVGRFTPPGAMSLANVR